MYNYVHWMFRLWTGIHEWDILCLRVGTSMFIVYVFSGNPHFCSGERWEVYAEQRHYSVIIIYDIQ